MGTLYRRARSRFWWCQYYVNGRPVRVSTGTDKERDAARFLKEREGRAAAGTSVLPRADRVRYPEAAADLRRYYETTGTRKLREAETRLRHLDAFFGSRRLVDITASECLRYAQARQQAGKSNGTVNRELGVLSKMLRLAYKHGKLTRLPVIGKLKEAQPRQGFFEEDQYLAVRRRLPVDRQLAVTIAQTYGWRMQSEVLMLERRHLDLTDGTLRVATSKNEEGRLVYLTPELMALIAAQVARVRALERATDAIIPWLFPHLEGRHRGKRIQDFRKRWATAAKRSGLPGALRHDFRRTAVRNLVNSNVPERVAMKITCHKTRSFFDRYHIVSPADLKEATRRLSQGAVPAVPDTLPGTLNTPGEGIEPASR
jgi:site-specific recombinase XerD